VVVRLDDGSGDLRSRCHSEGELGLAAVVDGKSLKEERSETRTGSATSGVEDHETLKSGTVISELSDAIKDEVNDLLADGVVTTGVVVGGIFLSRDKLLWVVELAVGTGPHFVKRSRLEIDEDSSRNVFAGASFGKKRC